ncbi:outer membrane beta-barrel protein [Marinobacterium lutimaris]|uniref:Outer membrane protein beta-barrel domain-containing protein n=1 Tax=Marinobacterium lutimaris TaxID=568106 RepID=A0A1H5U4K2_9GAMM|nr:outer membrane beta-barrel protein [Marinobacterium lutimaris]SEF69966.1 Outer membrane protein beta-barrel domain-containing protein [Marinobacterium lutimaris]
MMLGFHTRLPLLSLLLLGLAETNPSIAAEPTDSGNDSPSSKTPVWTGELETFYRHVDNLYAEHDQTSDDQLLGLSANAGVTAGSDELRWNANAGFESGRYDSYNDENYDDYWFNAGLQRSFSPNTLGSLGVGHNRVHEDRSSPDLPAAATSPTEYDVTDAYGLFSHTGSDLGWRLAGSMESYRFDDNDTVSGLSINNSDRDRLQSTLGLRLNFKPRQAIYPFAQIRADQRNYSDSVDDYGFDRDSEGYRINLGLSARITPTLSTEGFIGQLYQSYDDPRFNNISKVDFGGRLNWQITPATRLNLSLSRSLEETTLAGASGYLVTGLSGQIATSITPRDELSAGLYLAHEDYQELDRTDKLLAASLGYRHYLTKTVYLGASYTLDQHNSSLARLGDSSGASVNDANVQSFADYDSQTLMLTLGMRLGSDGTSLVDPYATPVFYTTEALSSSGLYAGVLGGSETAGAKVSGERGHQGTDKADYADSGLAGGAFLGYGYYIDAWYLGLEGSYLVSDADLAHSKTRDDAQTLSLDTKDRTVLDLRFGHSLPGNNLIYARVGGAYSRFDTYNRVNEYPQEAYDDSDSRWGLRYGLGTEIPTGPHTFLRLDYGVTDSRDYSISYSGHTGEPEYADYDPRATAFTLGLGWRMNETAPKAVDTSQQSGVYAGLTLGSSSLTSRATGLHTESSSTSPSAFGGDFGDIGHGALAPVIGYAWTFDSPWQLALEVDADLLRAGWEHDRDPTGRDFGVEMNSSTAANLRLGYRLKQGTLLFASVGKERARFNTDWIKGGNDNNRINRDDEVWGTRLGLGAEIPVGRKTALRIDYSETQYDDYEFTTEHSNSDSMKFDNSRSRFRTGLVYYF